MEANDHERMNEENDDPVVAEYDVFFHNTLSKSLTLFQYPLRPGWKSYEIRDEDEESMLTFFPACSSYSTSTYRSTHLSFYLLFFFIPSTHSFRSFVYHYLFKKVMFSRRNQNQENWNLLFLSLLSKKSIKWFYFFLFCIDSHMHTLYHLIFTLTNKQLLFAVPFS